MRMFGKAKGGGRRKSARSAVPMLGTLSTVANDYRVGLVDLSDGGAQFYAPDLPAEGEKVIFRVEQVRSLGMITWSHDDQCGVTFDDPLTRKDLDWLRKQPKLWTIQTRPESD